jgi:ADP-heptose:LPS heptosyltransferase
VSASPRILVARTDRLGDVLLSLPSLELLRAAFPESRIDFLVRPALIEVLSPYLASRSIAPVAFEESWPGGEYDGALVLFDEPGLLRGLWRAGVGVRFGAYSKVRSFFFLNGGRRQRRGLAERNEAEYGLELTRLFIDELGGKSAILPGTILFPKNVAAEERARAALRASVSTSPMRALWVPTSTR